jgi:uncharacterized protein (TIGR00297 family)
LIENALPSTDPLIRTVIGFTGAAAVSAAAVRMRALSASGAVAATLVGTLAVGAGWQFAAVLFGFFLSATLVSRYRAGVKDERLAPIIAKGAARDAFQVLANGSVFGAFALWIILAPTDLPMFAAVGALAGACADTWATEIGSLSRKIPRSILTGRQVPAGTSGGVTLLGAMAAVAGAASVALIAVGAGLPTRLFPACVVGGIGGAAADSLLGASLQSRRWCDTCKEHTERDVHTCGSRTKPAGGLDWLDNDKVNLACTLVAALIAALWVL